jgi:hypothetical protein
MQISSKNACFGGKTRLPNGQMLSELEIFFQKFKGHLPKQKFTTRFFLHTCPKKNSAYPV